MEMNETTNVDRGEVTFPTVMTFVIKTHLAGRHPGVVEVQGRIGGSSHNVGDYAGLRLYEGKPGEEGAAYHIAEAIYAEETRLRHSTHLHDARFDFSRACTIYFLQKWEKESASRKREIGSLSLPGGLSREEVCCAIAQTLVSGWEKPPAAAFTAPEQLTSEYGTIIYGRDGNRLRHLVTFEYNGRSCEAPVVFVAWCTGTMRFATIHPGSSPGNGGARGAFYRYFTLLETDQGWLLCDNGTHDLDEPLAITDRGTTNTWFYDMPVTGFPLTIRYDDQATSPPYSWETRDNDHFQDLLRRINTAVTTCSLYCSECRRSWLWDADGKDLHALREKGFLLTLCTHCWYCVDCNRWSTPTSREARYERFPCLHARPVAPEKQLQVQNWRMAKKWRAGRIRAQLPEFVHELPFPGDIEYDVLITFHSPWPWTEKSAEVRPERWKTVDIPAETRFVGRWDHPQPRSGRAYRVVLDDEPWSVPADLVTICCPLTKLAAPRAQFEIAQDSLRAAAELETKKGEEATLRQTYARAIIELAISGAPASRLASARHRYAHLLIQDGQVERATQEMELATREYGRSFAEFSPSSRDEVRFEWELQAADALMALGRLYLQQRKPAQLLWETAKRIHHFESEISKHPQHRATLIELKLITAHLFAESDDAKEATQMQARVENMLKGAPEPEQERYAETLSGLRAALHPEDSMLARLRDALAAHRGETLAQVREQEDALLSREKHMQWRDQCYSIFLRANRPSRPRGTVDLQENHRGMGSYTLRNGADLRVFELAQRGPLVAGSLLAELILSDLEARHGDYHRDQAIDYEREMTFIVSLSVGIGVADGGMRALRYVFFPYGECVFPGGMTRAERLAWLSDVLDLGVRLLAIALPDAPGAARLLSDGAREGTSSPDKGTGGLHRVPESDVPLLGRIRRYGLSRPKALYFRDHAVDLLAWVRGHLAPAEDGQGCQLWKGEKQAMVGSISIPLVPRELVWVLAHDEELPAHTELRPICGQLECVRPDHQLQVISATTAVHELGPSLGGAENARYAIEDGKRSGGLRAQDGSHGEEAFACTDFDLWQTSTVFAERYLSGKGVVGDRQHITNGTSPGQGALQKSFEQLDAERRVQVTRLWGVQTGSLPTQKVAWTWALSVRDPFFARCAWQALGPRERTVLFSVLGAASGAGVLRPDLLRETTLGPEELDAALDHLESLLLVHISYVPHPNREGLWQIISCSSDYGPALYDTGKEFFSPRDLSQLSLFEYLTSLPATSLAQVAQQFDIDLPRTSSESAQRRTILEALLGQPSRVFAELAKLDYSVQRLAAAVFEHDGRLPTEKAAATLETDLSSLGEPLRTARPLCFLHEVFAPGGERLIFIPSDLYEASLRHSVVPCTLQQLDNFLVPTYVREGQPWLLYDLAVFLWFVFHATIEPTQDDLSPVRIIRKMAPYLHILPRDGDASRDWRVELLDLLASYLRLIKPSTAAGIKTHYLPGEWLERWGRLDITTQTRLALLWWLQTQDWIDLIPSSCREGEITQKQGEARALLVSALQTLEPGRWYAISDLLNTLWERYSGALRGRSTPSQRLSRDRWMRADGLNYTGMLASTLHELGIVALGYHQVPDRDLETRLSPDLLQLTEVGQAVLSSVLNGFPREETPSAEATPRPLTVEPNFDVVFLVPDMRAVYRTLGFVEIQQIERISKMRLTQKALHDGLGRGWTIEQVLELLRELSPHRELPQNVLYTLREWASKHTSAQLSQAVVIEVPNESIANTIVQHEHLRRLGVRKLAPTILAVRDPAKLLEIRTVLLEEGITVHIIGIGDQ